MANDDPRDLSGANESIKSDLRKKYEQREFDREVEEVRASADYAELLGIFKASRFRFNVAEMKTIAFICGHVVARGDINKEQTKPTD